MVKKTRLAVLCGGRSAEHEVSLASAAGIAEEIDRSLHTLTLIGVTKDGRLLWRAREENDLSLDGFLRNADNIGSIALDEAALKPFDGDFKSRFDVVFPLLHGTYGEDGVTQGYLKMFDMPFVGAGVLGSALGMDKDIAKRLLRAEGIPVADFITLDRDDTPPTFEEASRILKAPFFIKPANSGSSVGVYKAHNDAEYGAALKGAFLHDRKVIIEKLIKGRELECAILGRGRGAFVTVPGEIIPNDSFYSYNAKYIDEDGARLVIPAKIADSKAAEIRAIALRVFNILQCKDLARVDFFLQEDGAVVVNEINTIPGFTRISMYSKLMEHSGITYSSLITRLVELGRTHTASPLGGLVGR